MTCSKGTDLVVWDLKGQKLAQIDTCLMSTTCAKISPCGRFIVASGKEACFALFFNWLLVHKDQRVYFYLLNVYFLHYLGFSPDAMVWEVLFSKSGEFQEVKRVFELSGHSSGISDVAFDVDTSHMATVSKDGTWKLFDTNSTFLSFICILLFESFAL